MDCAEIGGAGPPSAYSFGMRTRNTIPTMNRTAMESTPKLVFPVICVNTDIRNVPRIAAYLQKM